MNQNEKSFEQNDSNARIISAIRSHEWKRRLLTGIALTIGLLAITAGIAIPWGYLVWLEPKQKELLEGYTQAAQKYHVATNMVPGTASNGMPVGIYWPNRDRAHMAVTHDLGVVTMLIAASVALVGIGTLVTLVLVMVNRRVTLRQINESLAQISKQISVLENRPG